VRACVRHAASCCVASCRLASRRVARRRGDSAWHDHEKFRRSRSTFARRSKNLLSPYLSLSLSLSFPLSRHRRRRTGSATECPRVLCHVASSPHRRLSIDNGRLWPRKSFSSADFRDRRNGAATRREIARFTPFLFETIRQRLVEKFNDVIGTL